MTHGPLHPKAQHDCCDRVCDTERPNSQQVEGNSLVGCLHMSSDDSEPFFSALTTVCCLALCNWDPRLVQRGSEPIEEPNDPADTPTLRLPTLGVPISIDP